MYEETIVVVNHIDTIRVQSKRVTIDNAVEVYGSVEKALENPDLSDEQWDMLVEVDYEYDDEPDVDEYQEMADFEQADEYFTGWCDEW